MSRVLIIGGQSQIGSVLAETLPTLGWSVTTTSRSSSHANAGDCLLLDLAAVPASWPALPRVDAAIICAAVTSLQACERDPVATEAVNLDHTVALAQKLSEAGAFVLAFSTVAVFDGSRSHYRHDDPVRPVSAYGRQKAALEEAVLRDGTAAVLRLSKVIGPRMPLLRDWVPRLRENRAIQAFSDVAIAPISAGFVAELTDKILRLGEVAVYHASGDSEVPYPAFAASLCDVLGVSRALCEVTQSGGKSRTGHTTLDMSYEHSLFGMKQPSSDAAVREILETVASAGPTGLVS